MDALVGIAIIYALFSPILIGAGIIFIILGTIIKTYFNKTGTGSDMLKIGPILIIIGLIPFMVAYSLCG